MHIIKFQLMLKGVEDTALYLLVVFYKHTSKKLSCHYTVKLFNLQILSSQNENPALQDKNNFNFFCLAGWYFFGFFAIKETYQP